MDLKLYKKIYIEALSNAKDLCNEANLLFQNGCFARSYLLAYSGLEEIQKSQLAADVYTGYKNEIDYKRVHHKEKIAGVKWAHLDATTTEYWEFVEEMTGIEFTKITEPTFDDRQSSLYVDLIKKTESISTPKNAISEEKAYGIIHILETAISRIKEVTEDLGHQIGTKGFLK